MNQEYMDNMRLRLDVNNMMAEFTGKHGITEEDLEQAAPAARQAYKYFAQNRGTGMMGWSELPYNQNEIVDDILQTAQEIRKKYKAFVILGIGGSALGPIAVQQALNHLYYNELPDEKRGGPRLYVEDNVDPERMEALLDVIDLESTCFNVITKSGSTSETMTQYLIIWELLKTRLGKDAASHIIATTEWADASASFAPSACWDALYAE